MKLTLRRQDSLEIVQKYTFTQKGIHIFDGQRLEENKTTNPV